MMADHDMRLHKLVEAVAEGPGALDAALRRRACRLEPLPEPLQGFVSRVAGATVAPTGDDVERLRAAGYSQDQVFELAVCAALGAALQRLRLGLRALEEVEQW